MIDTMIFPTNLSPDNLIINSNFTYVFSTNKSIPYQGWKIHISATLDNYQIILDSVTTICLTNDTPFKFINSIEKLFFIFSKKTSQTEIGKFITIYPENDQTFLYLLDVLYQELKYESGIQIMTDQNYKQSQVIFYRYGLMNASVKNGQRPCLFDNNGVAYPDLPGAYYSCPEFVTEYFPEKTNTSTILNERYDMKSILYQTGAGNIYIAIDITNSQKVIIKEARKYVYATRDITSIELLKNEAKIIKKLSGSVTPNYIDDFYLEGNYYLVEEFIEEKRIFKTMSDNQEIVNIEIYESDYMDDVIDVDDDFYIGNAILELPRNLSKDSSIEVILKLNKEGILEVTGIDKTSGKKVNVKLKTKDAMTEKKLEEIKEKFQGMLVV